MASNDMNSWDDDPDEGLRRRWQQTFADFKVQAHPSLSGRILNSLPAGRRRRRAYRVAGLMLLVSVGLVYPFRLGERPYPGGSNAIAVRRTTPTQPLPAGPVRRYEAPGGQLLSPRLPVIGSRPGESVAHRQPTVNPPAGTGAAASGVNVSSGGHTTPRQSAADHARLRPGTGLRLGATAVPADQSPATSVRSAGTPLPVQLAGPVVTADHKPVVAPLGQSVSHNSTSLLIPESSDGQPLTNALPVVWARLNPTGILPLSSQLSARPVQLPIIDLAHPHPVEVVVARQRRQWFAEVVPLNSFQWMSVPPVATAYLSQVKAPAAFSPATWGYQVNGGIRWQHWQAHLSLGQVRRWAYYTVNENRYRVEPRPDNPNQLVRETYAVAENVSLPMIGVGLSQERLLDRGRYAVDLGGQATYLPTGRQALIGVRGGVGRRLVMSRIMELQVGLRVEYGLNRLLSEQQQVAIHPLMVGIGIRIQPRSYP